MLPPPPAVVQDSFSQTYRALYIHRHTINLSTLSGLRLSLLSPTSAILRGLRKMVSILVLSECDLNLSQGQWLCDPELAEEVKEVRSSVVLDRKWVLPR